MNCGLSRRTRLVAASVLMHIMMIAPVAAQVVTACAPDEMIEYPATFRRDFGTGPGRVADNNVVNHDFDPSGEISGGEYAIGPSIAMVNHWMQTDRNGHVDADGNTNGRYLGINIRGDNVVGPWTGPIYRNNAIPLIPATAPAGSKLGGFRFSAAIAGTCHESDSFWCQFRPILRFRFENTANGAALGSISSVPFGLRNDELWRTITGEITVPAGVLSANLVIENEQPEGYQGNDVGLDNLTFRPLICEPPVIRATQKAVLDNGVVGLPGVTEEGDTITYTYAYTNGSRSTAYNVTVVETNFQGAGIRPVARHVSGGSDRDANGIATDLRPGKTIIFQATYAITANDIAAGGVRAQATMSGTDLSGTLYADLADSDRAADDTGGHDDAIFTPLTAVPSIVLEKTGMLNDGGDGFADLGDTISYSFVVRNTGNVPLMNIAVSDPGVVVAPGPVSSLAPGAVDSTTFTASRTLQAAEIDTGRFANSATVRGRTSAGVVVSDVSDDPANAADVDSEGDGEPDDPTVVLLRKPVLSATHDNFALTPINGLVGGTTPSVLGNDTLNGNSLRAAQVALTPATAPAPPSGAIVMDAASGLITVRPGTTAGSYSYGYAICDRRNPTICAAATAELVVTAALITAVDDDFTAAHLDGSRGDRTASVLANDTLDVRPLTGTGVKVTPGPQPSPSAGAITMDPATGVVTIAPGTTAGRYEYPYTICETLNPANCANGRATLIVDSSGLRLQKTAVVDRDTDGVSHAGDVVIYSYQVANLGTATLFDIGVTETRFTGSGAAPVPTHQSGGSDENAAGGVDLQGGAVATFVARYGLTQADIDAGRISNQATARATDAFGSLLEALSDDPANANNIDSDGDGRPDDPTVVPLRRSVVSATDDDFSPAPISGADGGATASVLGNDKLNGKPFVMPQVRLRPGPAPAPAKGSISMDPNSGIITIARGTTAGRYSYPYEICESRNAANCAGATATLIIGTATIRAVADDFTASPLNGSRGDQTRSVLDNDTLNGRRPAAVDVILTTGPAPAPKWGAIAFDPRTGVIAVAEATTAGRYDYPYRVCEKLNPSNCASGLATIIVTSSGLKIEKTATMDKSAGKTTSVGDFVTYSFRVTNIGTAMLSNVEVAEHQFSGSGPAPVPMHQSGGIGGSSVDGIGLGGGETAVFAARYQLTQADLAAGRIANQAIATAADPFGTALRAVSDDPLDSTDADSDGDGQPDDPTVVKLKREARIKLEKTGVLTPGADGTASAGDVITYRFTVTNTGNQTLTDVRIEDALVKVNGNSLAVLPPGQSDNTTFSAVYSLTQPDIDAGEVRNTATVSAQAPGGLAASDLSDDPSVSADIDANGDGDPDDPTIVTVPASARMSLQKIDRFEPAREGRAAVGDRIVYRFVVRNDGSQTLSNIRVTDPRTEVRGGPIASLAPGEVDRSTFSAVYRLTQEDIDVGRIENIATATATDMRGRRVSTLSDDPDDTADRDSDGDGSPDDATVTILPDAPVTLVAGKSVSNPHPTAGETVTYTVTVQNDSSRRADGMSVIDNLPSGLQALPETSKLDGLTNVPSADGRRLSWSDLTLPAGETLRITFQARVTALDAGETAVNRAWSEDGAGLRNSNIAEASIRRQSEHVFDCTDVIGKVFDDRNMNGHQDDGEAGLQGVRVVTLSGLLITADDHGRFSVPCASLPEGRGENISLKVDTRSLPAGYQITTENPRVVRATAGKAVRMNFGAAPGQVSEINLTDAAFQAGTARIGPALSAALDQLANSIGKAPGVVRLTYYRKVEPKKLVDARLDSVEKILRQLWKSRARYPLVVERTSVRVK